MYIDQLRFTNLKCFDKVDYKFNWPTHDRMSVSKRRLENINLILGDNGMGKTTTFQALVIGILRSLLGTSNSGYRSDDKIRYKEDIAEINTKIVRSLIDNEIFMSDNDAFIQTTGNINANATIKRQHDIEYLEMRGPVPKWTTILFNDSHPGLFVAGYGASRRTERPEAYNERLRAVRYQRVATLFESHVGLMPLSLAYTYCQSNERWNEVVTLVNEILAPPVSLTNRINNNTEPIFDYDGIPLTLNSLSDGYRLLVGWLIDLLTHLARVLPKQYELAKAIGVVVVDEVDLFLSPKWQRTIMESLSNTFPNLQWICSTHSPLVAGSLESENIYILEQKAPYTTMVRRPTNKFEGESVEVVLSELFNVSQPRSMELQRQLSVLAEKAMEGDMDASIRYLQLLNKGTSKQ